MDHIWKEIYEEKTTTSTEELAELLKNVENGNTSDEEILLKVGLYVPSYNCEGAADGYLEIASKIAPSAPTIANELLHLAIKPMYYMGIETSEHVKNWIEAFSKKRKDKLNEKQETWLHGVAADENSLTQIIETIREYEEKYAL